MEVMEQSREWPKMVSQDSIQRQTAEQIVDKLVFKDVSQDRVQPVVLSRTSNIPCRRCQSSWRKCPTWCLQTESSHGLPSVDVPVPREHAEITKVSSRNKVQQRFEDQSVGQERIECRVEKVVDVPAGSGLSLV